MSDDEDVEKINRILLAKKRLLTQFEHQYSHFVWTIKAYYEDFVTSILPIIKEHPLDISV